MSFLTTSRQEQRNIISSQNIAWQNDDSKFGKVMLEKMGWKKGCGLGKYEQGITENLQVKANVSTRGLGCTGRIDDVLIAHHDSFAAILADLNKKKEKSKVKEVESEQSLGNIIVNKTSINDYFAEKMLKLSKKRKV
ncbi:PIN2/TERF1-interacting telomerase inhibitor 1 [Dirofilaria immitis]|nr:PIN2/TERF1-interacting telomerase inhibitor 1 [Dirofilaria immitis]